MKKNILFCLPIILTACANKHENIPPKYDYMQESQSVTAIVNSNPVKEAYSFQYIENGYELSKYEPRSGSYLGAYVLSNGRLNYNISEFEDSVSKEHVLYMYNLNIEDDMSDNMIENWILDCISKMKTPYIVLRIDDKSILSSDEYLKTLTSKIGVYQIPMFIQISTLDIDIEPIEYISFYNNTAQIIKENIPNAALVWSIPANDVYESFKYYPGDSYIDWVGLELMQSFSQRGIYEYEAEAVVDHFYYTYQKRKPLLISKFAVSHFSTLDHIYRTDQAQSALLNMYNTAAQYPRIKAIIYMDFNGINISNARDSKDNFSITDNPRMLSAYQNATLRDEFLKSLHATNMPNLKSLSNEIINSEFPIYRIDNEFYISEKSLTLDLMSKPLTHYGNEKFIDGQTYFNTKNIEKLFGGRFYVDNSKMRIIFSSS